MYYRPAFAKASADKAIGDVYRGAEGNVDRTTARPQENWYEVWGTGYGV